MNRLFTKLVEKNPIAVFLALCAIPLIITGGACGVLETAVVSNPQGFGTAILACGALVGGLALLLFATGFES